MGVIATCKARWDRQEGHPCAGRNVHKPSDGEPEPEEEENGN